MTRDEALNLYFLDARSKLIDLAAFLDRVERCPGEDDFRLHFRDGARGDALSRGEVQIMLPALSQ
jgi:hypothetical protein